MNHAQTDRLEILLLGIALAGLVAGLGLHFDGRSGEAMSGSTNVAVILNAFRALRVSPAGLAAPRTRIGGFPA